MISQYPVRTIDLSALRENVRLIKASLPEVPIIVDAACCAGVSPASHKNALEAMKMCQIKIVNE